MKNKKLILGMSLILLLNPVFAAKKMTMENSSNTEVSEDRDEKAKSKVEEIKKLFNITEKYEEFNILTEGYGNSYESEFLKNLTKDKYVTQYRWMDEKIGGIDINYDSDGNFISYNKWSNDEEKKEAKASFEDVEKKIKEFLPKVIKDFDKKYKLENYEVDKNDGSYDFVYRRYINDIPSFDKTVNISYSPSVDEFRSIVKLSNYGYYPVNIDDSQFKNDAKIDLEAAKKIFLEKFPLTLSYRVRDGKAEKVYYSEVLNIDAATGKVIRNTSDFQAVEYAKSADSAAPTNLTEVELKKIKDLKDLKSKKKAEKIIKEIAGGYEIANINLYSDKDDYFYSTELKKGEGYGNITVNARTLKLVSLHLNSQDEGKKVNFDEKDVVKIARDFVEKYSIKDEVNFEKPVVTKYDKTFEVIFPRYVNNLPVIGEGITVTINGDKKVVGFDRRFTKVDFSTAKDISLTKEKANEIYLNSNEFVLKYQMTKDGPKLFYGSINGINPLIKGDKILRDSNGNIINFKEQIKYEDLDKARDKGKINKLKEMNIGLIGKNLSDKINYGDFFTLLGVRDLNYKFIKSNYKIDIENLKAKNITEKDAVKLLVIDNSLEKFTKAKNIFKDDIFKNQKSLGDYEKYYIVAHGFGYVDENINPNSEITVEDALYLIYNTIY
ncbi:S-layer protein [Peptoniphilus sp. MSJ-1]|uniref:S-layer protein n=1 Tax=Peptoniphilus ovalis TaxID=2841503 RepID=A0ABS6FKA0_9FIRM|nr:YcdB/YcdC domain-containing protein [Peptoniphilus ovalis]MBU5669898.1 S-layer protein [Peptoniphilus ovalis]